MVTAIEITTQLNKTVLSLTPIQNWQAARRMNSNFAGQSWFVTAGLVTLIILIVLFVLTTYNRSRREKKVTNRLFLDFADERGLSPRERQILLDIATGEKLAQTESIFTTANVFDRGATKITRATLAREGPERSRRLSVELSVLREKLGFRRQISNSSSSLINSHKPSSRQIPAGKTVHITALKTGRYIDFESIVIHNDDLGLTVEAKEPIEIGQGCPLCVRYYFGASIWEFETSVLSCKDNFLFMNHGEDVRFVNRRRFLRVPVKETAYIAAFPFVQKLSDAEAAQSDSDSACKNWAPPRFIPADVTELAGPGLRVLAPLELKVGDRVVIILKLSGEKHQDSMHSVLLQNRKGSLSRIIEDIGVVRHTKAEQNGFSIAVELTGLTDPDLSELIRATNAASIKNRSNIQDIPVVDGGKMKGTVVSQTVINPGV